ncbi:LOB domain-containing protein 40-like protein [Carex littledalei]|uniref:LOB domain-containing protein 40-like protein n=1 Tax=Carex littledalei TaxID=544730 RepID=A0A833RE94_9POAL|nr:LOB domain-containing protein 40-like protein [Carex littledalei]
MSCNGCRVLRKGCSENCSIRPCLQWIKSPEAQGHATVFLAKFYGRAGLMNLINSGPDHLRPAVFRSLLYEACGRMVNPIYGSVGLLWSGSWPLVEAAVDAVLKGAPIDSIPSETAAAGPVPHPTYDIRHVSKTGSADAELHKVNKITRTRCKRTGKSGKGNPSPSPQTENEPELTHDSSEQMCFDGAQREASVDTVEAGSHVSQGEPGPAVECEDVGLDLTLGFGFQSARREAGRDHSEPASSGESTGPCTLGLALQLSA